MIRNHAADCSVFVNERNKRNFVHSLLLSTIFNNKKRYEKKNINILPVCFHSQKQNNQLLPTQSHTSTTNCKNPNQQHTNKRKKFASMEAKGTKEQSWEQCIVPKPFRLFFFSQISSSRSFFFSFSFFALPHTNFLIR